MGESEITPGMGVSEITRGMGKSGLGIMKDFATQMYIHLCASAYAGVLGGWCAQRLDCANKSTCMLAVLHKLDA